VRWADEPFVKLYTRDEADWLTISLGARGLFYELLRKTDRAGVLRVGKKGSVSLAALLRGDAEQVTEWLAELTEDGAVVVSGEHLVIPNYIEAQEARSSDKTRAQASRARARDKAMAEQLELGGTESHDVTPSRHEGASHAVTPCHEDPSHAVTICVTNRLDQTRLEDTRLDLSLVDLATHRVIDFWLEQHLGRRRPKTKGGPNSPWGKLQARLREGTTEEDLQHAIVGNKRSEFYASIDKHGLEFVCQSESRVNEMLEKYAVQERNGGKDPDEQSSKHGHAQPSKSEDFQGGYVDI
jgi:hypothetical protein